MSDELKPCPFCGSKMSVRSISSDFGGIFKIIMTCENNHQVDFPPVTKNELIYQIKNRPIEDAKDAEIKRLTEENKALKVDIDSLEYLNTEAQCGAEVLTNENKELKAEIKRLREALKIYADHSNWKYDEERKTIYDDGVGENGYTVAEDALNGGEK
jgi:hypothetical protein